MKTKGRKKKRLQSTNVKIQDRYGKNQEEGNKILAGRNHKRNFRGRKKS